jgi:O-antigen ligase
VLILLGAVMAFHATSGIVQHFTGTGFGGVEAVRTGQDLRIRSVGIFNDPNDLALAILLVIPFLLVGGFGRSIRLVSRLAAIGTLAALLLALYYTNSRGGILALAAIFVVFGWQRFGRLTGTIAVVVALAGLLVLAPSRLQQMDSEEASAQGRIQAWAEGLAMLKSRPITGVGYSQFTDYHPLVAHNSFVHSFSELGLLGGFFFVGMAYWYFESMRRVRRHAEAGGLLSGAMHTAFLASGVGLFVGLCFLSRQYNPVLYTMLALGASYVSLDEGGGGAVATVWWRDRILVLALTFMTVIVTWIAVRVFAVWGVAF